MNPLNPHNSFPQKENFKSPSDQQKLDEISTEEARKILIQYPEAPPPVRHSYQNQPLSQPNNPSNTQTGKTTPYHRSPGILDTSPSNSIAALQPGMHNPSMKSFPAASLDSNYLEIENKAIELIRKIVAYNLEYIPLREGNEIRTLLNQLRTFPYSHQTQSLSFLLEKFLSFNSTYFANSNGILNKLLWNVLEVYDLNENYITARIFLEKTNFIANKYQNFIVDVLLNETYGNFKFELILKVLDIKFLEFQFSNKTNSLTLYFSPLILKAFRSNAKFTETEIKEFIRKKITLYLTNNENKFKRIELSGLYLSLFTFRNEKWLQQIRPFVIKEELEAILANIKAEGLDEFAKPVVSLLNKVFGRIDIEKPSKEAITYLSLRDKLKNNNNVEDLMLVSVHSLLKFKENLRLLCAEISYGGWQSTAQQIERSVALYSEILSFQMGMERRVQEWEIYGYEKEAILTYLNNKHAEISSIAGLEPLTERIDNVIFALSDPRITLDPKTLIGYIHPIKIPLSHLKEYVSSLTALLAQSSGKIHSTLVKNIYFLDGIEKKCKKEISNKLSEQLEHWEKYGYNLEPIIKAIGQKIALPGKYQTIITNAPLNLNTDIWRSYSAPFSSYIVNNLDTANKNIGICSNLISLYEEEIFLFYRHLIENFKQIHKSKNYFNDGSIIRYGTPKLAFNDLFLQIYQAGKQGSYIAICPVDLQLLENKFDRGYQSFFLHTVLLFSLLTNVRAATIPYHKNRLVFTYLHLLKTELAGHGIRVADWLNVRFRATFYNGITGEGDPNEVTYTWVQLINRFKDIQQPFVSRADFEYDLQLLNNFLENESRNDHDQFGTDLVKTFINSFVLPFKAIQKDITHTGVGPIESEPAASHYVPVNPIVLDGYNLDSLTDDLMGGKATAPMDEVYSLANELMQELEAGQSLKASENEDILQFASELEKELSTESSIEIITQTTEAESSVSVEKTLEAATQQVFTAQLGQLQEIIKQSWWENPKVSAKLTQALINARGQWAFDLEKMPPQTVQLMLRPVERFLKTRTPAEREGALRAVAYVANFFHIIGKPSENAATRESYLSAGKVDIQGLLASPHSPSSNKQLSEFMSVQASQTLLDLKFTEFAVRMKHLDYFLSKPKQSQRALPCFLLTQDKDKGRIHLMLGHFDEEDSLQGFSDEENKLAENVLLKYLGAPAAGKLQKGDGYTSLSITLQDLKTLKAGITNSTAPDFRIFDRRKLRFFHEKDELQTVIPTKDPAEVSVDEASNSTEKLDNEPRPEKKRKRENWEEDKSVSKSGEKGNGKSKRRRGFAIKGGYQNLENVNPPVKPGSVSNGDLPSIPGISLVGKDIQEKELDRNKLWEDISQLSIEHVASKASQQKAYSDSILNKEPLNYPILVKEIIHSSIKDEAINPLLKPYQEAEVLRILSMVRKGYGVITAAEVGLGKTFIYGDVFLNMIAERPGAHLLVLPLSILASIHGDLQLIASEGILAAWKTWIYRKSKAKDEILFKQALDRLVGASNAEIGLCIRILGLFDPQLFLRDDKGNTKIHAATGLRLKDKFIISELIKEHINNLSDRLEKRPQALEEAQNALEQALRQLSESKNSGITQAKIAGVKSSGLMNSASWDALSTELVFEQRLLLVSRVLMVNPDRKERLLQLANEQLNNLRNYSLKSLIACDNKAALEQSLSRPDQQNPLFITSYDALTITDASVLDKMYFNSIVLDEASEIHTESAKKSGFFREFIRSQCEKAPKEAKPALLFATATPYENNINEIYTLLSILNPEFLSDTQNTLNTIFNMLQTGLVDYNPDKPDQLGKLKCQIYNAFGHFYNYRKIINPLISVIKKDEEIRRQWDGRIPIPKYVDLPISTDAIKADLESIDQEYRNKRISDRAIAFSYFRKVGRCLWHKKFKDMSLEYDTPEIKSLLNEIRNYTPEQREEFIKGSVILSALRTSERVRDFFNRNQRNLIVSDSLTAAHLVKIVFEKEFEENKPLIEPFNGTVKPHERTNILNRFKEESENPKVLILHPKAGGRGLNLAEANSMLYLDFEDWSLARKVQMLGRILRSGHEGEREIIIPTFGTFPEELRRVVQKEKSALEEFLLNKGPMGEIFHLFCRATERSAHHKHLNDKKNPKEAQALADRLRQFFEELEAETPISLLESEVEKLSPFNNRAASQAAPAPNAPPVIPPAASQAPQPPVTAGMALAPGEFSEEQLMVIPVPKEGGKELAEALGALLIQRQKDEQISRKVGEICGILAAPGGNDLRKAAREGKLAEMGNPLALQLNESLQGLYKEAKKGKGIELSYAVKCFRYNNRKFIPLPSIEKNSGNAMHTVRLYQRQNPGEESHYDLLVRRG